MDEQITVTSHEELKALIEELPENVILRITVEGGDDHGSEVPV